MNALEALANTCARLLSQHPDAVMLGEDVRDGGMLGLSRVAAQDPELKERLLGTPLTNGGLFAHAAGLAIGGRRPIVVLPSAGALLEGLSKLREVAALSWQSGGAIRTGMLILAPTGPGFGLGGEASVSPESMLAELPRVRVVTPSHPEQLGAMVEAAYASADEGPTIVALPRTILLREIEAFDEQLEGELGQAHVERTGAAATVFAWGASVELAAAAIDHLEADVELVDVRSLSPLDDAGLVAAAQKTGKIVIAHAGARTHGLGAELAARFSDQAIWSLDAPIVRVTGARGPFDADHEARRMPSIAGIVEAIQSVLPASADA